MTRTSPAVSRTNEFHSLVSEYASTLSESKRRKLARTSSSDGRGKKPLLMNRRRLSAEEGGDAWGIEAERIAASILSLESFLFSIRRAYLSLSSHSQPSRLPSSRRLQTDDSKSDSGDQDGERGFLGEFEGIKHLTDKERDEIDFGVKVGLKRCVERVRELEDLEKIRSASVQSSQSSQNPISSFTRFLNLPPPPPPPNSLLSQSNLLNSHRNSVTMYLNSLLARVSEVQKWMQEKRIKRRMEREGNLGGLGGIGSGAMGGMKEWGEEIAKGQLSGNIGIGMNGGGNVNGKGKGREQQQPVPSIYSPSATSLSNPPPRGEVSSKYGSSSAYQPGVDQAYDPDLDAPIEELLSPEQQQALESETSHLLKSTNNLLSSIQSAQSSLSEISSLQSQLAVHLVQQAETSQQLWEESLEVNKSVEEGNKQLKKARERGKSGRILTLCMLVGACGSLLFLDYYS